MVKKINFKANDIALVGKALIEIEVEEGSAEAAQTPVEAATEKAKSQDKSTT